MAHRFQKNLLLPGAVHAIKDYTFRYAGDGKIETVSGELSEMEKAMLYQEKKCGYAMDIVMWAKGEWTKKHASSNEIYNPLSDTENQLVHQRYLGQCSDVNGCFMVLDEDRVLYSYNGKEIVIYDAKNKIREWHGSSWAMFQQSPREQRKIRVFDDTVVEKYIVCGIPKVFDTVRREHYHAMIQLTMENSLVIVDPSVVFVYDEKHFRMHAIDTKPLNPDAYFEPYEEDEDKGVHSGLRAWHLEDGSLTKVYDLKWRQSMPERAWADFLFYLDGEIVRTIDKEYRAAEFY